MAHRVFDRVMETSTTTGTGAMTLAGAVTAYKAFSGVFSDGDTTLYAIVAIDGTGQPTGQWETGLGTYSAGVLTRTTPFDGSAATPVNFAAGTKRVFVTQIARAPLVFQETTEPADPATSRTVLWAEDQDGITMFRHKGAATGVVRTFAQDAFVIARNNSGSTITKGSVVYVSGSSGQRPTIALAKADSLTTSPAVGIAAHDIGNNTQGLVMISGHLFNLNTSSFSDGQVLFLSASTAGTLTSTSPAFPNFIQRVALVTNAHATQGKLLVDPDSLRRRPEVYRVEEVAVTATPTAPADGVGIFTRTIAGRRFAAMIGPSGLDTSLQPMLGRNKISTATPQAGVVTLSTTGMTVTATGTATLIAASSTNLHQSLARLDYLVTTPATTAVAGFRQSANSLWRGNAAGLGGFTVIIRAGAATGVSTSTRREFIGVSTNTAAPTDVQPSSLVNCIGAGHDAADSNWQVMHNDGTGSCTKIDLGASFARATADRTEVIEVALFCPPNVSYVNYQVTNLVNGAIATGQITTDFPSTTTFLSPRGYCSVGGTSSVVGMALMGIYTETDI